MKWQNILNQTRNTQVALGAVLVTVLVLTFVHRRQLSALQQALSSIYMDRLVVEAHLYQLSHEIFEKKMLVDRLDDQLLEQNIRANDTIQQLIERYEGTYLTTEEEVQLSMLKDHIRISQQFEQQFIYNASPLQREALRPGLTSHYDAILVSLNRLTKLQLSEGEKLMDQSSRVVASGNLTSRLAVAMLLVLGLLIYFLFSPARSLRRASSLHLN